MSELKEKLDINIDEIRKEIEKEFPNDPAIQEIHIARKILSKEAKIKGLSFYEYIKSLRN